MNEYRERIHQAIGKAEEPLRLLQSGKLDRKTALTLIHKLDWKKAAVVAPGHGGGGLRREPRRPAPLLPGHRLPGAEAPAGPPAGAAG